MIVDPFTDGDASVAIHADTCGTSTTHPGRCTLDCWCWCHFPSEDSEAYRSLIRQLFA